MTMATSIDEMLRQQEEFQRRLYGVAPKDFMPDDRAAYVREMMLAHADEMHEALGEVGWKSWASSRHLNRDAYVSELIDAWHFYMNLLLVAGVTGDEFSARYEKKIAANHARQDDGYDGVSTKCPGCRRDVNDDGVDCAPTTATRTDLADDTVYWCVVKREFISRERARLVEYHASTKGQET
jgi:hypothetical protein